nr:MAG TPA: hypothetical protein [Caudoviricetes sp.]
MSLSHCMHKSGFMIRVMANSYGVYYGESG